MSACLPILARGDDPRKTCGGSRGSAFCALTVVFLLVFVLAARAQVGPAELMIVRPEAGAPIRLNSPVQTNTVVLLEESPDVREWSLFATLHDAARGYPDVISPGLAQRFYRASSRPRVATDDWKNQIGSANEVFRSSGASQLRWVKFAVLANDLTRVYYQDSTKYAFHFDYATLRLPPFLGMDRATFDQLS